MTDARTALQQLEADAQACRLCPLGSQRTQAVVSRGTPDAEVVFVGEAPGFHEDQQGKPFVGASGQLLDKLVREQLGLDPETQIFVVNVLNCRPPGNRDPSPAEIDACKPFMERKLALAAPRVVVTLGNFATKLLLATETGITRLHGQRFPYRDAVLIPTFHPAAALRGGSAAREIVADFQLIRLALDERPDPAPADPEQLGLF